MNIWITNFPYSTTTRLTYKYMKNSYRQIIKINNTLQEIAEEYQAQGKVIFYGPQDEILELLKIAARNLNLDFDVVSVGGSIEAWNEEELLVVTWGAGDRQQIDSKHTVVNLLERM